MESLIVLGFDVRKPVAHQKFIWPGERRHKFLLRPEIPTPVSVDRNVWPTLSLNTDESYPLFLWGSISEILAALPEVAQQNSDSPVIVEIAVVATLPESSTYWERIIFGRVNREADGVPGITAECIGYDVADRYLLSGLSNCMLSEDELALIRNDWSKAINIWGLFGDSETGKAFRAVCNRLVPEHAPFETYRMRMVKIAARV
jgi:hypothetical protein